MTFVHCNEKSRQVYTPQMLGKHKGLLKRVAFLHMAQQGVATVDQLYVSDLTTVPFVRLSGVFGLKYPYARGTIAHVKYMGFLNKGGRGTKGLLITEKGKNYLLENELNEFATTEKAYIEAQKNLSQITPA